MLLAWTKIVLAEELLASDLPDDPYLVSDLRAYFPRQVREGFEGQVADHPLRRQIIVTQVVNDLVNGAGMTFWPRLAGETGASAGRADPGQLRGPRDLRLAAAAQGDQRRSTTARAPRCRPGCASRCARWSSAPRAGWSRNRRPPLDSKGDRRALRERGAAGDGPAAGGDERPRARGLPGAARRAAGAGRAGGAGRPGGGAAAGVHAARHQSRWPGATGWTRSRWPGCTSRWGSGSGCRCW